ncbi:MAG: hypothetical protein WC073_11270 [Sterolibacterium sp.]
MKITAGPVVQQYAAKVGVSVEEVISWLEDYIDGKRTDWFEAMCRFPIEATPTEREESIRGYLKQEIQ